MNQEGHFVGPALVAGIMAGVVFFPLRAVLESLCRSSGLYAQDFDPLLTSLTISLATFTMAFPVALLIDRKKISGNIEKFDKIAVIAIIAWFFIWIGYVIINDGDICSKYKWRTYSVMLILPTALFGLVIFARDWLKSDE